MSMLKALQAYIAEYQAGSVLSIDQVLTGNAADKNGQRSLAPTGNGLVRRDVTGNVFYQNNYVLYMKESTQDERHRQDTFELLEDLQLWLEGRADRDDLPLFPAPYVAESIAVSNGMLMDVAPGGAGIYQIQIRVETRKELRSD